MLEFDRRRPLALRVEDRAEQAGEPFVELLAPQMDIASGPFGSCGGDPRGAQHLHVVAERRLGDRRVEFAALPLGSVREQPDYPQPGGQGAPGYGPYGPYSNGQF